MGRTLAVDPGEKRIGLAISDPTGTIANPLSVIRHVSRLVDAAEIASVAAEYEVERIVVGQALDADGRVGPSARHALKLAEAIRTQTSTPVDLWDESDSTNQALHARRLMGGSRSSRRGHLDEIAATIILQSYLDKYSRYEENH